MITITDKELKYSLSFKPQPQASASSLSLKFQSKDFCSYPQAVPRLTTTGPFPSKADIPSLKKLYFLPTFLLPIT